MSTIPAREEALFSDALAQPAAERGAFLAQACGTDLALLARLVALVASHESRDSMLPPGTAVAALHEERPGELIGRYKLLQKIGEGGCGMVWMAEQEEPVRRRVALKIIKLGMDTKAVVARFEAERQALAMMDHPNIAKVHDAGATETGRPYFVMELVRGIPITRYCDENHLTPTARLELFIKVCHAIQHAHQKGIIHRDLKPSNILVTVNDGAPTPMIIDFGIAKATQGKLTNATVFTAFEQFIGTPAYMSPEQAEMSSLDVDARSDIYSLGVLLYELLTGRPPFDPRVFAQAGVDEIRHHIREDEPPRPSVRLRTLDNAERTLVARLRSLTPAQLPTLLRGDLDWIVMRCLEKDRTRRYDSLRELALDLERYLRNDPILARPPSAIYRLQKLVRRQRGRLAIASGFIGVMALAAVWWTSASIGKPASAGTPVVVLMDSPYPTRVYDPATLKAGGTNSDDITDALAGLSVRIVKETTSSLWHREHHVLAQNPALIILHRSCFFTFPDGAPPEIYPLMQNKLIAFLGYIATLNPRTRFIVYSRHSFEDDSEAAQWRAGATERFPILEGRIETWRVPLDRPTFRDPATARELRASAERTLGLSGGTAPRS